MIRGAAEFERTSRGIVVHRLPSSARTRADQQVLGAEKCTAGVRLAVKTKATVIELEYHRTTTSFRGMPPRPDGIFDVLVDGVMVHQQRSSGGSHSVLDLATGQTDTQENLSGTVSFDGLGPGEKHLEIWLPHQEPIELMALRADASVIAAPPDHRRKWLHHGSSISQGSNAESPTATWPALAAAAADVSLTNLGFSGGMMLDSYVARAIRDMPADLISIKVGINIVGGDMMRRRIFAPAVHGFLDTVRDGHPDTPLLVIGPIQCPIHERTPGPGAPDFADGTVRFRAGGDPADVNDGPIGKLSLEVVRDELVRVVAQRSADANLYLMDGLVLYGESDASLNPLPDRLHPDSSTHRLIAERFTQRAFGPAGPFFDR
jgi:hypothetical protein